MCCSVLESLKIHVFSEKHKVLTDIYHLENATT